MNDSANDALPTKRLFVRAFAQAEFYFPAYAALIADNAFVERLRRLQVTARCNSLSIVAEEVVAWWDHDLCLYGRISELCVTKNGTFFFRTVFDPQGRMSIETSEIHIQDLVKGLEGDEPELFFGPLYPYVGTISLDTVYESQLDEVFPRQYNVDEEEQLIPEGADV